MAQWKKILVEDADLTTGDISAGDIAGQAISGTTGAFTSTVSWTGGSSGNANTAYTHSQIAGGNSVHVSTTENTQWDTAYTYSQVGHLPLAGGTLTGNLIRDKITIDTDHVLFSRNGSYAASRAWRWRVDDSAWGNFDLKRSNGEDNTIDTLVLSFNNSGNATFSGSLAASNLSGTNTGDQTLPTRDSLGIDTDDAVTFASVNTGQGANTLYDMNQNVLTTSNVSFANLTVTGDLSITGDINSYNVTDLDVVDKTITIGKGQTEGNSGGSGLVVDGSSASMLWDETNDEWDFNKSINVTGTVNATNYKVGTAQGSDGQVLTSTGSGVAWEAATGDGYWGRDTSGSFPVLSQGTDNDIVKVTSADGANRNTYIFEVVNLDQTADQGYGAKIQSGNNATDSTLVIRNRAGNDTAKFKGDRTTWLYGQLNLDGQSIAVDGGIKLGGSVSNGTYNSTIENVSNNVLTIDNYNNDNLRVEILSCTFESDAMGNNFKAKGNLGSENILLNTHSDFTSVTVGPLGFIRSKSADADGNRFSIANNAHYDTDGSWEYIRNDEAALYETVSGKHEFYYAAGANAGTDITFTRMLSLDTDYAVFGRDPYTIISWGNSNTRPWLASLNNEAYGSATYGWQWFNRASDGDLRLTRNNNSTTEVDVLNFARSSGNATFAGDVYVSASGSPSFRVTDTTNTVTGKFQADDTVGKVGTHTNHSFQLFSNNTTALTIDTSQNATFAGTINANGGFERRLDQNSGTFMTLNNQNAGTSAYAEMYIKNSDGQLVIGYSDNYASGQWDGGWLYTNVGNMMIKSAADVEIFAGGLDDSDRAIIVGTDGTTNFYGTGYVDATRFRSSANTNYYTDPDGTSALYALEVYQALGMNNKDITAVKNIVPNGDNAGLVGTQAAMFDGMWTNELNSNDGTMHIQNGEVGTGYTRIYGKTGIGQAPDSNYILACTGNTSLVGSLYVVDIYASEWFRNEHSGEGIYNQATTQHFYSDHDDWWNVAGGTSTNGIRFRDDHAGTVRGGVLATSSNEIGFMDKDEAWCYKHTDGGSHVWYSDGGTEMTLTNAGLLTVTGGITASGLITGKTNASISSTTIGGDFSGAAFYTNGGDIVTGRIFFRGGSGNGDKLVGINNEGSSNDRLVVYNYTDATYLMKLDYSGTATFASTISSTSGHIRADSDGAIVSAGVSQDIRMYHNGSNSFVDNNTGHLYIRNLNNGGYIILEADNSPGTTTSILALSANSFECEPSAEFFEDITMYGDYFTINNNVQNGIKIYGNDTACLYIYDKADNSLSGGLTFSHDAAEFYVYTNGVSSNSEALKIASNNNATFAGYVTTKSVESVLNGSDSATSGSYLRCMTASGDLNVWMWQLGASNQFDLWNYNAGGDNAWEKALTFTTTNLNATFAGDIYGNDRLYLGTKMALDMDSTTLYLGSTSGSNKNLAIYLRTNDANRMNIDDSGNIAMYGNLTVDKNATDNYQQPIRFMQHSSWSDLRMGAQGNEWWIGSNVTRSSSGYTHSGASYKGTAINFFAGDIYFNTGIAVSGTQAYTSAVLKLTADQNATFAGSVSATSYSGGAMDIWSKNGSYARFSDWLECSSSHGIYWPSSGQSHSSAPHLYTAVGDYGSLRIQGKKNNYAGLSISGRVVFMHNDASDAGLFNDVDNHWMIHHALNGATTLYHAGVSKLNTTAGGATVTGLTSSDTLSVGTSANHQKFTLWNGNVYMSTNYYITWANGNAQIGENGAYGLEFKTYNSGGTGLSNALTLDTNKLATFTGVLRTDSAYFYIGGRHSFQSHTNGYVYLNDTSDNTYNSTYSRLALHTLYTSDQVYSGRYEFMKTGASAGDHQIYHHSNNYVYLTGGTAGLSIKAKNSDDAVSIYSVSEQRIYHLVNNTEAMVIHTGGTTIQNSLAVNTSRTDASRHLLVSHGSAGIDNFTYSNIVCDTDSGSTAIHMKCTGTGTNAGYLMFGNSTNSTGGYVKYQGDSHMILRANANLNQLILDTDGSVDGNLNNTSDVALKTNIVSLGSGLDYIKQLRPVNFDWREFANGSGKAAGFIAQEVELVTPENVKGTDYFPAVNPDTENEIAGSWGKSINVTGIVAYLTKAVQELSVKNDALEAEVEALKNA